MSTYVYAYNPGSRSAKALSEALECRMIRHERSRFHGRGSVTVINWGSSELPPEVQKCQVLNRVDQVRVAGNKLETFRVLKAAGVSIPEFTVDPRQAQVWLEQDRTVVVREILTGHSGRGITILEKGLDFIEAPLYATYLPKQAEYRVHVMRDQVIDVQRKIKDPDRDVKCWKVRSHDNGFIFVRLRAEDNRPYLEVVEREVKEQALLAVRALGLDFSGVDVIWNAKNKKAYVLEANCAVGLENTSVEVYANAFRRIIR